MHLAISKQYLEACSGNEFNWDLIVSSPMLRCYEFAEMLSHQLAIPLVTNEILTEISFGEEEGKSPDEIKALDPILFHDFHHDPVKNRPLTMQNLWRHLIPA